LDLSIADTLVLVGSAELRDSAIVLRTDFDASLPDVLGDRASKSC